MIISAVHRLDRLVSGLLILARNAAKADIFRQQVTVGSDVVLLLTIFSYRIFSF